MGDGGNLKAVTLKARQTHGQTCDATLGTLTLVSQNISRNIVYVAMKFGTDTPATQKMNFNNISALERFHKMHFFKCRSLRNKHNEMRLYRSDWEIQCLQQLECAKGIETAKEVCQRRKSKDNLNVKLMHTICINLGKM